MKIPTASELKELASIRRKIDGLTVRAAQIMGVTANGSNGTNPSVKSARKPMSKETRAAIQAAQLKRWAKIKKAVK